MLRGCFKKKDHENWSTGSKVIKQFCHKNTVVGLTWSSMLPCLLFWDIITQQTMTSRRHFFSGGAAIWMAVMQKLQGRQVHNLEIIISGQVAVELFAKNYQNIVRKKVHFSAVEVLCENITPMWNLLRRLPFKRLSITFFRSSPRLRLIYVSHLARNTLVNNAYALFSESPLVV